MIYSRVVRVVLLGVVDEFCELHLVPADLLDWSQQKVLQR